MSNLNKVIVGIISRFGDNICNRTANVDMMNPNLARLDIRERSFLYNEMRSKIFPWSGEIIPGDGPVVRWLSCVPFGVGPGLNTFAIMTN